MDPVFGSPAPPPPPASGLPGWVMFVIGAAVVIGIVVFLKPATPALTATAPPLPTLVPVTLAPSDAPTDMPSPVPTTTPVVPGTPAPATVHVPARISSVGVCANNVCNITLTFTVNGKTFVKKTSYAAARHILPKGSVVKIPIVVATGACAQPCVATSGTSSVVLGKFA